VGEKCGEKDKERRGLSGKLAKEQWEIQVQKNLKETGTDTGRQEGGKGESNVENWISRTGYGKKLRKP